MLLDQTSQNEWVDEFGFTHDMDKDASLSSSLGVATKNKIYVDDDFALDITANGDIPCQHGWIVDVYHVPSLSGNLSFSQLT